MNSWPATLHTRLPCPRSTTRLRSGGSWNRPSPPPARYLPASASSAVCRSDVVISASGGFEQDLHVVGWRALGQYAVARRVQKQDPFTRAQLAAHGVAHPGIDPGRIVLEP